MDKTNLVCDPATGDSRGFAFITMVKASAAEDAIKALDGYVRLIHVLICLVLNY